MKNESVWNSYIGIYEDSVATFGMRILNGEAWTLNNIKFHNSTKNYVKQQRFNSISNSNFWSGKLLYHENCNNGFIWGLERPFVWVVCVCFCVCLAWKTIYYQMF